MRKTVILLLAAICIIPFIEGCVKIPKPEPVATVITISNETLQFSDIAGSQTLTITSNNNWTISGSGQNCNVSPLSGEKDKATTVTITLTENQDADREFTLSVNSGTLSKPILVKQSGKNYAKNLSELTVTNFSISPEKNEKIYSKIDFIRNNGSNYEFNGNHSIRYYRTDLNSLKASWVSNASKVTVNEVVQSNGETANNFSNEVIYRFYAKDNSYKEFKITLTNPEETISGLPVLVLNTLDGSDITSKETWKGASFILDPQGNPGIEAFEGETEMKGRGNSTWIMPKKPYNLKLKDKAALCGMNPNKRWILLANYADKTGLRNKITFEIGRNSKLAWTPDSKFVEVIFNGKFLGNYLLTEQIRIDSKRVNIEEIDNTETNSQKITGGWLLEIDRFYNLGETRYFRPDISQLPIIVKDPEDANNAQMDYIKKFFRDLELIIFPGFPEETPYYISTANLAGVPDTTEYHNMLDITTFIDYWIIQEVTGNGDSRLPGSVYMYKDVGGKLCAGPLWDFDQTTFMGDKIWMHYDYAPNQTDYFDLDRRTIMYRQLFRDPKFKARAKARWNEFYNFLNSDVTKLIDQEYQKIAKSQEINWIDIGEDETQGVWGLSDDEKNSGGRNRDKNLRCKDAVDRMKIKYQERINWLNSQIASW